MRKTLFIFFCVVVVTFGVLFLAGVPRAISDELPKLRGITTKDDHPQGCVSCHVKVSEERDYRLIKELTNVEDHPKIDKIVKVVPKDCMICHKEGKKAGEFSKVVHEVHFRNPEENHFISIYKGDCLQCHRLDTNTWEMGVKSGPKNW